MNSGPCRASLFLIFISISVSRFLHSVESSLQSVYRWIFLLGLCLLASWGRVCGWVCLWKCWYELWQTPRRWNDGWPGIARNSSVVGWRMESKGGLQFLKQPIFFLRSSKDNLRDLVAATITWWAHIQPHQLLFHPPRLKSPYSFLPSKKQKTAAWLWLRLQRPPLLHGYIYIYVYIHISFLFSFFPYSFLPSFINPIYWNLRIFYFLLLDGYDAVANLLNRFKLATVDFFPLHIFPSSWTRLTRGDRILKIKIVTSETSSFLLWLNPNFFESWRELSFPDFDRWFRSGNIC